jgi:hypothetical protein
MNRDRPQAVFFLVRSALGIDLELDVLSWCRVDVGAQWRSPLRECRIP